MANRSEYLLLKDVRTGDEGILEFAREAPADSTMQRLMSMGLVPGVAVKVIRVAPLGDPVMLEVSGYLVCVRRRESEFLALLRNGPRPTDRQESNRAVADTTLSS